ncbi:hypothetical protein FHG87_004710 [Trinorchestia longiramus]|nr:hypothetical protein FHG87_004710 [Trinorchestia longiramus]
MIHNECPFTILIKTQSDFTHYFCPKIRIILEAAYSLHDRCFIDNLGTVLVFAVLGTLMNVFLVGFSLWGLAVVGGMGEITISANMLRVPVCARTSLLEMWFCHEMPRILLRQWRWKVFSLRSCRDYRVQLSLLYNEVLSTQAWYTLVFVLMSSVTNGDAGSWADVLADDFGLFDADRETKLFAGVFKAANELLEASLGVSCQGGIVSKQHLTNENFVHFCICVEVREVEQAAVASGVSVHTLLGLAEGVEQQQGEKDVEECRRKDSAQLDSALDREWVRERNIVLDRALHDFEERCDGP